MTSELGPSTRALLDAARGGGPDAAAIARMRTRIDAAVAPPAVATAATKSALAGKLGLVALAVLVGAGAFVVRARSQPAVSAVEAPDLEHLAPVQRGTREAAPVAGEPEIEMPAAQVTPPRSKPVVRDAITLAREVELVDRAQVSLRRGDTSAALAALRIYTLEAGTRGQLVEDAAAIEVEALCISRAPNARGKLASFEQRWPASAQRARLATSCR